MATNPIYSSINQDEIEERRVVRQPPPLPQQVDSSSPTPSRPPRPVSNPMYSSIDGLEARRSFVVQRTDRVEAIQRSNSAAAISSQRTKSTSSPEADSGGPPLYSTIVPRHLRQHNHRSSSIDQEQLESRLGERVSTTEPHQQQQQQQQWQVEGEEQTYSTLKH